MKQFLYTKYRMDYAFFEIENGERKLTDSFALSLMENKLCRPSSFGLEDGEGVTGKYALYWREGALWRVDWSYETYADPRGYTEAHFYCLKDKLPQQMLCPVELIQLMIPKLLECCQTAGKPSGCLRFDMDSLFEKPPADEEMLYCIKLFYLLLPENTANSLVFFSSGAGERLEIGAEYPDFLTANALAPYPLDLLHTCISLTEYKLMLRLLLLCLCGMEIVLGAEAVPDETKPVPDICAEILAIWKHISAHDAADDKEKRYREALCVWCVDTISQQLDRLRDTSAFTAFLEQYQKILEMLRKPENLVIFSVIQESLTLQQLRAKQHDAVRLQEGFQAICTLQDQMLASDTAYYTGLFFERICRANSGAELTEALRDITFGSEQNFYSTVHADYFDAQQAKQLCTRLMEQAFAELQKYHGFGDDKAFQELSADLDAVYRLCVYTGYPFYAHFYERYMKTCRDPFLISKLTVLLLNEQAPLSDLLTVIERFRIEDMFLCFHPGMLRALRRALCEKYGTDQEEIKAFARLLEQYQTFHEQFQGFLEQQSSIRDLENAVRLLYEYCPDLLVTHIRAYNLASLPETKAILRFLNKAVAGSPAAALFLMYAYQQKFVVRSGQNKYYYYYQFFELLYYPLIHHGTFSFMDCRYLLWMFEHNVRFEQEQEQGQGGFLQNMLHFGDQDVIDAGVSEKEEEHVPFQDLLCRAMRRCTDCDEAELRKRIEHACEEHMDLIQQSQLIDYYEDYTQFLRNYLMGVIKRL